jgi:predicted RNase H-like HicB family nuclease
MPLRVTPFGGFLPHAGVRLPGLTGYTPFTREKMAVSDDRYTVRCEWDPEARVWVATSDDVPGLATGADTLDELIEKLKVVIPELLDANGLLDPDQQGDIPFAIIAERHETAPRAA